VLYKIFIGIIIIFLLGKTNLNMKSADGEKDPFEMLLSGGTYMKSHDA
jgi:hypothetical protein